MIELNPMYFPWDDEAIKAFNKEFAKEHIRYSIPPETEEWKNRPRFHRDKKKKKVGDDGK